MPSVLLHSPDESISLSSHVVKRLIDRGDGDAALLYLALLRHHGDSPPRALAGELHWDLTRIDSAEFALRELGLIAPADIPDPADEKPAYQNADVIDKLSKDSEFASLSAEVERRLGKKLTTPDLSTLLGLYDYLGLPADVIYLLVCHCAERVAKRFGEGRRPTLRQIEKEGYAWSRRGIDSQRAASEYLRNYSERQGAIPLYMRALQLGDRLPSASEEKFLVQWQEWGFPPESVALAYDKTVLKCHEFKWNYCNGILKRWNASGLHALDEIESKDSKPRQASAPSDGQSGVDWMREYIQERKKED